MIPEALLFLASLHFALGYVYFEGRARSSQEAARRSVPLSTSEGAWVTPDDVRPLRN